MKTADDVFMGLEEIFLAALSAHDPAGALLVVRRLCKAFEESLETAKGNPIKKITTLIQHVNGFAGMALQENMPAVARTMYSELTATFLRIRTTVPAALQLLIERYNTDATFFAGSDDPFHTFFVTEVFPLEYSKILEDLDKNSSQFLSVFEGFSGLLVSLCRARKVEAAFRGITLIGNFGVRLELFSDNKAQEEFLQSYLTHLTAIAKEIGSSPAEERLAYTLLVVIGTVRKTIIEKQWYAIWEVHLKLCGNIYRAGANNLIEAIYNELISTFRLVAPLQTESVQYNSLVNTGFTLYKKLLDIAVEEDGVVWLFQIGNSLALAFAAKNLFFAMKGIELLNQWSAKMRPETEPEIKRKFMLFCVGAIVCSEKFLGPVETKRNCGALLQQFSGQSISGGGLAFIADPRLFGTHVTGNDVLPALKRIAES